MAVQSPTSQQWSCPTCRRAFPAASHRWSSCRGPRLCTCRKWWAGRFVRYINQQLSGTKCAACPNSRWFRWTKSGQDLSHAQSQFTLTARWCLRGCIFRFVRCWLHFLPCQTPTVPPHPDLSDGTPVYLYAVICSSDHCCQPHANLRTWSTLEPLPVMCWR